MVDRVYVARRGASPDDAHELAHEALELARGRDEPELLVRALMAKGQCCRDAHEFEQAERLYVEAANLCRREDDVPALVTAHVIRHLGDVTAELGRFGLAKTHYEDALEIYRQIEGIEPDMLANGVRALARIHDRLDDPANAADYWREARGLYSAAGLSARAEECERRLNGAG